MLVDDLIVPSRIDLFGEPISQHARTEPYFTRPEIANTWSCSFCEGVYPLSLGVDIVILGPAFMLNFCTGECAEAVGYQRAGALLNARFRLTGEHWIVLTDDERVPDPRRPADVAAYADAIDIYTRARIERPTFEMLLAQSEASEDEQIEAFLRD